MTLNGLWFSELRKWFIKGHFRYDWRTFNIDYELDNIFVSMWNFLDVITVLWLQRRMSLFLGYFTLKYLRTLHDACSLLLNDSTKNQRGENHWGKGVDPVKERKKEEADEVKGIW